MFSFQPLCLHGIRTCITKLRFWEAARARNKPQNNERVRDRGIPSFLLSPLVVVVVVVFVMDS